MRVGALALVALIQMRNACIHSKGLARDVLGCWGEGVMYSFSDMIGIDKRAHRGLRSE